MDADKLKQYIALFGGWLGGLYLLLQQLNVQFEWFTTATIDSFVGLLSLSVPFILVGYGVWKNSYIVSKKAKAAERLLKEKGMK